MIEIKCYTKEYNKQWEEFLSNAKNSHFFFHRDYMEYHSDRFEDFSLIIKNEKGKIIALLPASREKETLVTHGGLTFGGFITGEKMTAGEMLEVFAETKEFLLNEGISKVIYKCLPCIYMRYPAEEDKYALFINEAKLIRRDISSTIYLPERYKYQKGRKWMVNRGKKYGIEVRESKDFKAFMELENSVLSEYHDTKAVHTAEEIGRLADLFPENIHLYVGELAGELLAGTIIFENGNVVHTQYMANSEKGREMGALDRVIDFLIMEKYSDYRYFDFGISTENQGKYLNKGLIGQKEGFGGRAIMHDFYEWSLK